MNKTKRLILNKALDLFNEHGLAEVSLRTVAQSVGISPGNLTYHFKRREEIVEALYYEFVESVDVRFNAIKTSEINLKLMIELISILTETRLKYRFLMRDFISLIAANPGIKKQYVSVVKKRKEQSMTFFKRLIEMKLLRKPELANEYEFLYDRIQILGNFWIASTAMHGEKLTKAVIDRNLEMIRQIIYPYLTDKGKKEWKLNNLHA